MASGHSYKSVSDKFQSDYVDPIFAKGTSRRIYGELFDSSDCILHISDARDPLCTTCESLLQYLKKEKAQTHYAGDEQIRFGPKLGHGMCPSSCRVKPFFMSLQARYIQYFTPRYRIIAFHASQRVTRPAPLSDLAIAFG